MANTTYSFAKAVAITDYLPAFIDRSKLQSWDWGKLFTKKKTNRATEQIFSYAGLPVARKTGEMEQIYYADMSELAATTYTVAKYTLATLFSHELLKDNQHLPDLMKEAGQSMGDSHAFIRDVHAAAFLNRAFNSSYTMFDGVELCGDHTMKSGDTFTNKLTTASLTWDNLWTAINSFETAMYTQSGLYLRDTPKFLVYHPSKEKEVQAILKSTLQPGTADNDKNTIQAYGLVPIPCRHLSTSTNWFLAGEGFPQDNLWFDREKVSTAMEDSFDLMATKIRTFQRFASGVKNFTHIFGNEGS